MTELDDVLSEKAPETPAPEPVVEAVAEAAPPAESPPVEGRERNPDGTFKAREQEAVTEPAAVEAAPTPEPEQERLTPREAALLKAVQAERHKRQAIERELLARAAPPIPEEAPKSFYDDPEGHVATIREEMIQMGVTTRLNTAEMIARSRHPDFDEKVQAFGQVLMNTPGVKDQWLAAADPAEFAYQVGNNHIQLSQAGSIGEYRKQVEKEIRLRVEQEYKAKQEAERKARDAIPDSLSDARGSVPRVSYGGPTSLDAILKV